MGEFDRVAVLGAGVIGSSWAALFLAAGLRVEVFDPVDGAEKAVRDYIDRAWPTLQSLGLTARGDAQAIRFHSRAREAVRDVQFVQESVPERLALKHQLYADIERHLKPDVIVATSASGMLVSEMQKGWRNPSRFLLGHPFNPPHLIPLVELLTNERTADDVLEAAEAFYRLIGKVTIRVKREVPAHVANRLQAALWREAIHLVESGVASVEDVDKAVWAGPGLRWAAMDLLKQQPSVDGEHIAAIGYCFGGGVVLEMARRGVELDAVASFHGSLGTSEPAKAGAVLAQVAVFNGADDPFVKPEQIQAFKAEMDTANVEYVFVNYPGAVHAFTNPDADANGERFDLPLKYDAAADNDSWAKMQEMFKEVFSN